MAKLTHDQQAALDASKHDEAVLTHAAKIVKGFADKDHSRMMDPDDIAVLGQAAAVLKKDIRATEITNAQFPSTASGNLGEERHAQQVLETIAGSKADMTERAQAAQELASNPDVLKSIRSVASSLHHTNIEAQAGHIELAPLPASAASRGMTTGR